MPTNINLASNMAEQQQQQLAEFDHHLASKDPNPTAICERLLYFVGTVGPDWVQEHIYGVNERGEKVKEYFNTFFSSNETGGKSFKVEEYVKFAYKTLQHATLEKLEEMYQSFNLSRNPQMGSWFWVGLFSDMEKDVDDAFISVGEFHGPPFVLYVSQTIILSSHHFALSPQQKKRIRQRICSNINPSQHQRHQRLHPPTTSVSLMIAPRVPFSSSTSRPSQNKRQRLHPPTTATASLMSVLKGPSQQQRLHPPTTATASLMSVLKGPSQHQRLHPPTTANLLGRKINSTSVKRAPALPSLVVYRQLLQNR